jgi:hypothetical protein
MKRIIAIAAAAGLLALAPSLGFAQSSTSDQTPGHKMQNKGSKAGEPGASGYSPGHRMQDKGSKAGQPGASGYAPGHRDNSGMSDHRSGRDMHKRKK